MSGKRQGDNPRYQSKVLLVGGTQIGVVAGDVPVRQIPFSFAGLAKAYSLVPTCHAVVYYPDAAILDAFPSVDDFDAFNADQPSLDASGPIRLLHPLAIELGLLTGEGNHSVLDQIASSLAAIENDSKQRQAWVRRSATAFVSAAMSGTYNIVKHGGLAVLCVPEDYPNWSPTDQRLMSCVAPGLRVMTAPRWQDALVGSDDLKDILRAGKSGLVFAKDPGFDDPLSDPRQVANDMAFRGPQDEVSRKRKNYYPKDGDHEPPCSTLHITEGLVPDGCVVDTLRGVQDRSGGHRLLEFRVLLEHRLRNVAYWLVPWGITSA